LLSCAGEPLKRNVIWPSEMSMKHSLLLALLLSVTAPTSSIAQGRSPLVDKVVQSVTDANPKWHFLPGFCTCPALVRSQTAYGFGVMYYGQISDHRDVMIYVSYVPTTALAAHWLHDLRDRNAANGWRRDDYNFADEAYLFWASDPAGASLYFRRKAAIVQISGRRSDVQFFAHTLLNEWAR
jgi:hypothetical protein